MWDPPRPGLEPVSPALAGRLSTTAPPGKPQCCFFIQQSSVSSSYQSLRPCTIFITCLVSHDASVYSPCPGAMNAGALRSLCVCSSFSCNAYFLPPYVCPNPTPVLQGSEKVCPLPQSPPSFCQRMLAVAPMCLPYSDE